MIKIQKIVIGIRPASKMFRIRSLNGQIMDTLLSQRGQSLDDDYFSEVAMRHESGATRISSKALGNSLHLDHENIVFIKDGYDHKKVLDLDTATSEFAIIWRKVNEILNVRDIRRIGIFAEHRIPAEHASQTLINALTTLKSPTYPAKFQLQYEDRKPTKESLAPDVNKSDFFNIRYEYYDSEVDADHPTSNSLNANLDVQRYYSPLLQGDVPNEVKKLLKEFLQEQKKFSSLMNEKKVAL